jgi:hypothetical protein
MWAALLPLAKSIVIKAVQSPSVKELVIQILERIVANTDNDLDDLIVAKLKRALLEPSGTPISQQ